MAHFWKFIIVLCVLKALFCNVPLCRDIASWVTYNLWNENFHIWKFLAIKYSIYNKSFMITSTSTFSWSLHEEAFHYNVIRLIQCIVLLTIVVGLVLTNGHFHSKVHYQLPTLPTYPIHLVTSHTQIFLAQRFDTCYPPSQPSPPVKYTSNDNDSCLWWCKQTLMRWAKNFPWMKLSVFINISLNVLFPGIIYV